MIVYANGVWIDEDQAVVPMQDMGFLYGDSLFETVRINAGRPFRPVKHLERLAHGMATIRMPHRDILPKIEVLLHEFLKRNLLQDGLIRAIVTRGTLQDLPWGKDPEPNLYVTGRPLSKPPSRPARVTFYAERDYPILRFKPAIKSGNYLGNLLAKKDAQAEGAYEPVFIDADGFITECAIRNIFFIRDGTLLTPSTDLGILPGVIRDTVMEIAHDQGLDVREAHIPYVEIDTMDEAFITSTGVGILPVFWTDFTSEYAITSKLERSLIQLWQKEASHAS